MAETSTCSRFRTWLSDDLPEKTAVAAALYGRVIVYVEPSKLVYWPQPGIDKNNAIYLRLTYAMYTYNTCGRTRAYLPYVDQNCNPDLTNIAPNFYTLRTYRFELPEVHVLITVTYTYTIDGELMLHKRFRTKDFNWVLYGRACPFYS